MPGVKKNPLAKVKIQQKMRYWVVGHSFSVISPWDGEGFEAKHASLWGGRLELPDVRRATSLSGPNTGTSPWRQRLIKVMEVSKRGEHVCIFLFVGGWVFFLFFLNTQFFLPMCAFQIHKGRVWNLRQVCWFVIHCPENEFSFVQRAPWEETNPDRFTKNIQSCRNVQSIYNTSNQSRIFFQ